MVVQRKVLLASAAIATALIDGCARDAPLPSRRVNRVLGEVAPGVQLGAVLPRGAATDALVPDAALDVGDTASAFRVVRVVTASTLWDQLRGVATDDVRPRRDRPVEVVYLQSADTALAASLVERITATFHESPSEACAGFDGAAVDRVLVWRAGDRGGVALVLPRYRAPGSDAFAQVVAYMGRWRADRIEIGYEPGPCPASRLGARR